MRDDVLATPLQFLKGVGPRKAADLKRAGLITVEDLLYRLPFRYEDRSRMQPIASLRPGETVLDLGAGGGFDAFLAARVVGPTGKVIGVDMTPDMVSLARAVHPPCRRRQPPLQQASRQSAPSRIHACNLLSAARSPQSMGEW